MEKDFEGHSDERSGRPEGNFEGRPRRTYRRYDESGETAREGSRSSENESESGSRSRFHSDRPYRSSGGYRSNSYRSSSYHSNSYHSDDRRPYHKYDNDRRDYRSGDGAEGEGEKRPYRSDDHRQGGYHSDNRRSGGYRSGGYRSDGYHSDRSQGGYRSDGYHSERRSDGYHSDHRQDGYRSDGKSDGYRSRRQYDDRRPYERKPFRKRVSKPVPQPVSTEPKDPNVERLNKFIANSGICSRREADQYIQAGVITVNGQVVTTLGAKIDIHDDIRFNGERVKGEENVYILMNKPKDFETTTSDPHAEKTVMDLIDKEKCPARVYPVGRLDKDSTGILLFTNDGELTEQLTHPSYNKKKIYEVVTDKDVTKNDFDTILKGVELEDGLMHADQLSYVDGKMTKLGVEIHSGANRVVRRMFEALGYKVKRLDRVYFAGLTKGKLRRGAWRFLTEKEVSMLKSGSYE